MIVAYLQALKFYDVRYYEKLGSFFISVCFSNFKERPSFEMNKEAIPLYSYSYNLRTEKKGSLFEINVCSTLG